FQAEDGIRDKLVTEFRRVLFRSDTAALASNILKFGVPKAWDGGAFLDSDHGARLNRDLVMVTHPWIQYYLTAAAFLVFGENTFEIGRASCRERVTILVVAV